MDTAPNEPVLLSKEARTWAMACHLAALAGYIIPVAGHIIGPLVVWLLKREEFPFVDDQGKEAVNFQITLSIALFVSFLLCFVFIGFLVLPIVGIAGLIFMIIAAVKANDGVKYRYPATIRFIK